MPRRWTLVGLLLAILTFPNTAPLAIAQVATTQVADTIYRADGSTASGTVIVSWPQFTTAAGQAVPGGTTSVTIPSGGALSVQLAPNAGSNPMGSYYTAVYHLDDGTVSRQYWVVPVSGTPVKVSAISSTVLPLSVAQQTASISYVNQAIAQATAGGALPQDTTGYVRTTGDTMTGPLVLPGDPTATTQAADKHYVDTSVQAVAAGVGQKVSLVPLTTQVVVQPGATQLSVNNLNGVEYATQYVNGQGNNGVANTVASAACTSGCEVKVEQTYNSLESYVPTTWNNQTHLKDARQGGQLDVYVNPRDPFTPGQVLGQTTSVLSTQQNAVSGGTVVSQTPNAVAQIQTMNALTGGSNLFPQSIEGTVPYFKNNYTVQQLTGNYNTMGQHSLDTQVINCYGVGDCLMGSQVMHASGGFRDEADEGAHPSDRVYAEDTRVFTGTCASGCGTGSTSVTVAVATYPGTQGEGRYLIDKNPAKVLTAGLLTGGVSGSPYPTAVFSGTSFPLSVFFATAQLASSQANNIAPGTVTLPIATSGVTAGFATNTAAAPAASGVACVVDKNPAGSFLPHNYEMATYAVVDSTHLRLNLNKVHAAGSTVAIGGLCGYGLEQTVDTQAGIRQVFPVVGSISATSLYYAGGLTPVVGIGSQTSGYANLASTIATVARSNNVVTLTTAGNFPQDINGLAMTVSGVADSSYNGTFTVTTTSSNTLTYAQSGANSTSSNGSLTLLTGGYALYPMAEVLGVLNPTTKQIDGQLTLAPNTVAWATGDAVEEPHYYQERIAADVQIYSQTVPRPTVFDAGGISYDGMNAAGLTGWEIKNTTSPANYFGAGGTHLPPTAAYNAQGVWQKMFEGTAGTTSVFDIHCNYQGCNRWNSTYDLFDLDSSAGVDTIRFQPQTSTLNIGIRGANYVFSPQSFSAGTINAGTLNASTINGQVSGNSITSGAVAAAYLPLLGGSGAAHAAGIAPDPGAAGGTTRFLREDGTWSVPAGGGSTTTTTTGSLLAGATADYNFLQGSGTVVADSTGSGNNATFVAAAPPTWTSTGLAFLPGQGVSLPAALNGTQTFLMGVYINPITAGNQPTNQYPILISSSTGGTGFNFMYSYTPVTPNPNFVPNVYAPALYVNGQVPTATPNLISGFHVLAAVLGSGSGSVDHVYIDGTEVATYTAQGASAGAETAGNLILGSAGVNPWQTSGINGTLYRLRTYPTQLSAAAVQSVTAAITADVASRGVATAPVPIPLAAPQLHAIGDSITLGYTVSTPWPSLMTLTNQPAYTLTNWGITGITLAAINGSEPNRAALRCRTSSGSSLALVFAGTNDFSVGGSTTASTVMQNLLGEVQTMKQAGCKVFVGTMISRGGTDAAGRTFDSDKDAYDALILSQAKAGGADGVIDFAANPLLGADGANAGSYFQTDHIHPTQAGQALLAAAAANVLNYTYGYNQANPHVVTGSSYQMTAGDGYVSFGGSGSSGSGSGSGSVNLFDATAVTAGDAIRSDTGALYPIGGFTATDYMNVAGGTQFVSTGNIGTYTGIPTGVAFFTGTKAAPVFLSGFTSAANPQPAGTVLSIPSGATLMRLYFEDGKQTLPYNQIMVCLGTSCPASYVGYGTGSGSGGGPATLTLPDCTGQSGAAYSINNPQAAVALTVAPLTASQPINGLSTMTVPSNGTMTVRDTPNPKAAAGCHWEM